MLSGCPDPALAASPCVAQAGKALSSLDFGSGWSEEDAHSTQQLVRHASSTLNSLPPALLSRRAHRGRLGLSPRLLTRSLACHALRPGASLPQVSKLVNLPELQAACPTPFDEGLLWTGHDPQRRAELRRKLQVGPAHPAPHANRCLLRAALPQREGFACPKRPRALRALRAAQTAFHNITRLMDCVGCEKCKMHGKLNVLGIATALKVLFSSGTEGELLDEYDEGVAVDLAGPLGTGARRGQAASAARGGSDGGA